MNFNGEECNYGTNRLNCTSRLKFSLAYVDIVGIQAASI